MHNKYRYGARRPFNLKTILRYLTHLIHFLTQPEYDIPVLCSLETQHDTYTRYFAHHKERAHDDYAHNTTVWRESIGEPS